MKKIMIAAILAAMPVGPLFAQSMNLSQFLDRATKLEKKGAMAIFSSDMTKLKNETNGSFKVLRAERMAAEAAGKKPAYCPPPENGSLGVAEILGHFRSIPEAQRARMTTKQGFQSLLARKFPCR
jgi:hypothetical protein